MRSATREEATAVDRVIEKADRRGLVLRVDSLEKVLAIIGWFSADHPDEDLVHRIREALTPRKDGYVVTIAAASAALPAGRVMVFPGTADVNGRPVQCVGVVVSVEASWEELERRRAEA